MITEFKSMIIDLSNALSNNYNVHMYGFRRRILRIFCILHAYTLFQLLLYACRQVDESQLYLNKVC